MIEKSVSEKILVVGPDYRVPKGGIAQLLNTYSSIFESYNFIATVSCGNKLYKLWNLFFACLRLVYSLLTKDIRIVHIHAASDLSFFRKSIIIILAKIFKVKIVLSLHAGDMLEFYEQHLKFVHKITNKCDVVIALTPYWQKEFAKRKFCHRIECIPNTIKIPNTNVNKPRSTKLRILFLGSICHYKGIFDVIKCFIKNKDYLKEKVILNICGVGESTCLDQMIIDSGITKFVNNIGWVDGIKKEQLLMESDILIQPSYIEAFGIAVIEAMSYHLPVIGSKVGGIVDLIDDGITGYLIDAGDMEMLMKKLQLFIVRPELVEQMGNVAFERVKNYYPIVIEKQLSDLYKSLL